MSARVKARTGGMRGAAFRVGAMLVATSSNFAHAQEVSPLDLRGALGVDHLVTTPTDPAPSAPTSFVLAAILVEGATIYSAQDLSITYADSLAAEVTLEELTQIADAITARYRSDGYFLSRAMVPAQDFAGGVARIRVYEGYIGQIRIEGEDTARAVQILQGLTEARPVRLRDIDGRLAILRDVPGAILQPAQIEPDIDDPRAHTLIVNFRIRRNSGELNVDNRGSNSYGDWRFYGRGARNSVFHLGDQLSVGVFTAPGAPDELLNGEITYTAPINNRGDYATMEAGVGSFADDDDEIRTFQALALRLSHPFAIGRLESLWGHLELAALNVEKEDAGLADIDEQVRTLSASVFARRQREGDTTSLFSRLLIGRASSPNDSLRSRFDADDDFATLSFLMRHTRDLQRDLSLQIALTGQIASGPLVSSEEIAFGGAMFGRGYRFGAARGDHGLGAAAELRYAPPWDAPLLESYRLYLFYDAATVWNEAAGGAIDESLASAGGGLRLTPFDGLFLQFEAGRAFTNAPHNDSEDPWRRTVRIQLSY